jgi:hypothetical protein
VSREQTEKEFVCKLRGQLAAAVRNGSWSSTINALRMVEKRHEYLTNQENLAHPLEILHNSGESRRSLCCEKK